MVLCLVGCYWCLFSFVCSVHSLGGVLEPLFLFNPSPIFSARPKGVGVRNSPSSTSGQKLAQGFIRPFEIEWIVTPPLFTLSCPLFSRGIPPSMWPWSQFPSRMCSCFQAPMFLSHSVASHWQPSHLRLIRSFEQLTTALQHQIVFISTSGFLRLKTLLFISNNSCLFFLPFLPRSPHLPVEEHHFRFCFFNSLVFTAHLSHTCTFLLFCVNV